MRARKQTISRIPKTMVNEWVSIVQNRYTPEICKCLKQLSEDEVWWRPNSASNSVGNMALHLEGNVRQWIIAGLGGEVDCRNRVSEFGEQGPLPRAVLIRNLRQTVTEARRVLSRVSTEDLLRKHFIQGYTVSGYGAITSVLEHFAYHAGQILYITKMKRGKDLKFTRLPAIPSKKTQRLKQLRAAAKLR